ncbi:unnamed protein product [Choristocarpus tenellus]
MTFCHPTKHAAGSSSMRRCRSSHSPDMAEVGSTTRSGRSLDRRFYGGAGRGVEPDSANLQDLRLQFCALARKLQGLEEGSPCPIRGQQASSDHKDRAECRRRAACEKRSPGRVKATQEVDSLRSQLEEERRAREGAERALSDAQHLTAQARLECDRLARVVNSFGGRTLEEITAEADSLQHRLKEAQSESTDCRRLADAKSSEALSAATEAFDLRETLEREVAFRAALEERGQALALDTRTSLRQSARARESARALSQALQRSEAQRASLTQRLSVLRANNQRLEKKVASTTGTAATVTIGDTQKRTGGLCLWDRKSGNTHHQCRNGDMRERRQGQAGHKVGLMEMQSKHSERTWLQKLREVEVRANTYKVSARVSEEGLQEALKRIEDLEETVRILTTELNSRGEGGGGLTSNVVKSRSIAGKGNDVRVLAWEGSKSCQSNRQNEDDYLEPTSKPSANLGLQQRQPPPQSHDCDNSPASVLDGTASHHSSTQTCKQNFHPIRKATEVRDKTKPRLAWVPRTGGSVTESIGPIKPVKVGVQSYTTGLGNKMWGRERREIRRMGGGGDQDGDGDREGPGEELQYTQLLEESRRLREDALSAVGVGPTGREECSEWSPLDEMLYSPSPPTASQSPPLVNHQSVPESPLLHLRDESPGNGPAMKPVEGGQRTRISVPIDILSELYSWGKTGQSRAGIRTGTAVVTAGDGPGEVKRADLPVDLSPGQAKRTSNIIRGAQELEGESELPFGVNASLANEVRNALEHNDEELFLNIMRHCGKESRNGIARLLAQETACWPS